MLTQLLVHRLLLTFPSPLRKVRLKVQLCFPEITMMFQVLIVLIAKLHQCTTAA